MVSVSLSRLVVLALALVLGVAGPAAAQAPIGIGDISSSLIGRTLEGGAGSPIAPGASGPREPASQAEGACRASGMLVKQNPAPLQGGGGAREETSAQENGFLTLISF